MVAIFVGVVSLLGGICLGALIMALHCDKRDSEFREKAANQVGALLTLGAGERKELLDRIDNLCSRIQVWEPSPAERVAKPFVQPGGTSSQPTEAEEGADIDAMVELGVRPTSDGEALLDPKTGITFSSLADVRDWRELCRKKGLPPETDPNKFFGLDSKVE